MEKLYLFSGLGADERLFQDLKPNLLQIECLPFIPVTSNPNLQTYAKMLSDHYHFKSKDLIGGASFGGMIALEISKHIDCKVVIQIGSATSKNEIPALFHFLKKFAPLVPDWLLSKAPQDHPLVLSKFGDLNFEQRKLFVEMAQIVKPEFLKQGIKMIFDWAGIKRETLHCPCFRIHGTKDRLIKGELTSEDTWIKGGGHLISMTHPGEVSSFLDSVAEALPA